MKLKLGTYKIRPSGRGAVLTIPTVALEAMKLKAGDDVELYVDGSTLFASKIVKVNPAFSGIVSTMGGSK